MSRQVVVLGAGIVGVSTAVRLREAGHDVTLVDRATPGLGTSFGNAGLIASGSIIPASTPGVLWKVPGYLRDPLGPLRLRLPYALRALPWLRGFLRNSTPERVTRIADGLSDLLHGALEEHQQLAAITGASAWIRTSPYYFAYDDRAAYEADAFIWGLRRERGVRFEGIEEPQLRRELPMLSPALKFAVKLDDHGFVLDPARLVQAHADHFVASGGRLLTRTVTDLEMDEAGPVRLITDAEPVPFDTLVVTAGVWSGWLASKLGLKIPLESERGYHVTLEDPGIELQHPIGSASGKFIATPMTPGIRIAGTVEFAGLDAPADPARYDALRELARRFLPGIRTERCTEWMGQRPSLPDSLPVIGRSPRFANVLFGFGHQHIGLTSGPRTGRILADLVSGRPVNIDLAAYRPDRF